MNVSTKRKDKSLFLLLPTLHSPLQIFLGVLVWICLYYWVKLLQKGGEELARVLRDRGGAASLLEQLTVSC